MRFPLPVAAAAGALTLAAALGATVGATAVAPAARGGTAAPAAATAVVIRPALIHVATVLKSPPTTAFCEQNYGIACYQPKQIQRGFDLPALYRQKVRGKSADGAGQTIIIVDSYGSPTVGHDLKVFDTESGLPAPPSLQIIQPAGKVAPYQPNSNREGWAGETDLDVEYAHTIAPGASILLVETPTSENEGTTGFPQIVKAEEYVIDHHLGGVISQSFSATEQTFPSKQSLLNLRGAYVDASRKGVTVLAASGDSGAADVRYNGNDYYLHRVTSWPDSDPLVTGVGGAQLHLNAAGQPTGAPSVWNDTYSVPTNEFIEMDSGPNPLAGGGGKSVIFSRPRYQYGVRNVVGDARGVPDISMSGACNGAADMYQSFKGQPAGWYPTCGTSEATPEFAGIVALADQVAGHPLGPINPYLYPLLAQHSPGIVDITSGNNTVSFTQGGKLHTVRGFDALPGYDLASGVGTVDARSFVYALANAARHRGASS
jgi:subtilase family serine protease